MSGRAYAAAIALVFFASAMPARAQHLVINEVDYDQPGTDLTEFIEIYNPGPSSQDLTRIALVFVNGSNNTPYLTVSLGPAGTLPSGGYLVVKSTAVVASPGASVILFAAAQDNIQNGSPDGVALIDTSALTLIDAFCYEGPMTLAQLPWLGVRSLVEGTALGASVADLNTAAGSLARTPNGMDTDNASADWAFTSTPTPGAANPSGGTGIDPSGESADGRPSRFLLFQNYPNPFNPTTVVGYQVPVASDVRLAVYDLLGHELAVLVNQRSAPGYYEVTFDASGLSSGVYVYRLTAGEVLQTRRMTLVR